MALARTTGQRGPLTTNSTAERDHIEREAAKRARMEITKSVELEESTSNELLQNTNDLWEAFGWSEATKKKLPSERS